MKRTWVLIFAASLLHVSKARAAEVAPLWSSPDGRWAAAFPREPEQIDLQASGGQGVGYRAVVRGPEGDLQCVVSFSTADAIAVRPSDAQVREILQLSTNAFISSVGGQARDAKTEWGTFGRGLPRLRHQVRYERQGRSLETVGFFTMVGVQMIRVAATYSVRAPPESRAAAENFLRSFTMLERDAAQLPHEGPGLVHPNRTAPSSWSDCGWKELRWGMGLEDVVERIARENPETDVLGDGNQEGEQVFVSALKAPLYGLQVMITFTFSRGLLKSLELMPEPQGKVVACEDQERWLDAAKSAIEQEAGQGRCETHQARSGRIGHQTEECEWRKPHSLWARTSLSRFGEGKCGASLEHMNPGQATQWVSAELMRQHTPSASWKKGGWQGLRWGMGMADVIDSLKNPKGSVRASHEPECYESGTQAGTVECMLTADQHALAIGGDRPALFFEFTAGRLTEANLHFRFTDGERARAKWAQLGGLLREKYGAVTNGMKGFVGPSFEDFGSLWWAAPLQEVWINGMARSSESYVAVVYTDPSSHERAKQRGRDPGDDKSKL